MKRAWRGAMPVALTLPLGLERRPRRRQTRLKRLALGALIVGAALLAAGFWLPAKAEIAQRLLERAADRAAASRPAPSATTVPLPRLATLAVGDEVEVERPGGAMQTYRVTALDVVDSRRTEISHDVDDDVVVLVTHWPFGAATSGGQWRYVVTARRAPSSPQLLAASTDAF